MRKVTAYQALVFALLASLVALLAGVTALLGLDGLPLGDFRGVVLVAGFLLFLLGYAILMFRLLLIVSPLNEGEIAPGAKEEFVYHVYLLFFLIFFQPVMRSGFLPVPLLRLFYQSLGARFGANSYTSGIVWDPLFVQIGHNCLLGQGCQLIPHVIERDHLAHHPISIGNGVTVGALAVVLAGVIIEDDAVVAAGAVVRKGTRIGAGEIWGGVPARCLNRRQAPQFDAAMTE